MKKRLQILVIFDSNANQPDGYDYAEEFKQEDWYTEAGIIDTLKNMNHIVEFIGIHDNIAPLYRKLTTNRPDVVFNLTEVFANKAYMDKNIPAFLELMQIPYTGCKADGLILCNNKALSKEILTYHRIKTARFHPLRMGNKIRKPARLNFPLIVKPLREEASTGISQASHVMDEHELVARVRFIHENMKMNAIVEEYIQGQELYVSVIGSRRLQAFPPREMQFSNFTDDMPQIATYKAKWDEEYRKKWGIRNGFATGAAANCQNRIQSICKRAYRALNLDGYARFDCRFTPEEKLYIIEANGNPELAMGDEFAESAEKAGVTYDKLLNKILSLAFLRH